MNANSGARRAPDKSAPGHLTRLRRGLGAAGSGFAGPVALFVVAFALLAYGQTISEVPFWLGLLAAAAAFALILARTDRRPISIASRGHHRLRDHLTGLGNEYALYDDLAAALHDSNPAVLFLVEIETPEDDEQPAHHSSRTETLREIAGALADAAEGLSGLAYRIDGARFGIIAPAAGEGAEEIVATVRLTLDRDVVAGVSYGAVSLPIEADQLEAALQIAEGRLSDRKRRSLRSARRQAHSALTAALGARRPELRRHVRSVVPRVIAVGRRLGISEAELDDVVVAAGLQDIGLLSVPESILEKAGPLTKAERVVLRRHPVEAAKIIGSAASLAAVADLVRSSYERWDGSGYPDGLAGAEIPLGARIISPCVALAAMTAPRPHRGPLNEAQAIEELRSGSGTQFDPQMIDLLTAEMEDDREPTPEHVSLHSNGHAAAAPSTKSAAELTPRTV